MTNLDSSHGTQSEGQEGVTITLLGVFVCLCEREIVFVRAREIVCVCGTQSLREIVCACIRDCVCVCV